MAITTPSSIQISKDYELLVPNMAAQPLKKALENLNFLWKWHRPAVVDVCPTMDTTIGRHTLVYPIMPSADGLRHTFEIRLMPSNTSTCQITVDYTTNYTGGGTAWVNIYTVNPATTAATLLTRSDTNLTIPATAVALRFDFNAAAGTIAPQHILVYPAPNAPSAGIKASGFIPFDDGMLTATGAPVHTEILNRCKLSAMKLLRDRKQQVISFLQKEGGTPWITCPSDKPPIQANAVYQSFQDLPAVRLFFPFQGPDVTIDLRVLADVDAGGTADLVRVRQLGVTNANAVTFDASGSIESGTLGLHLQGSGLERYADLAIAARTTAGNHTRLRAVGGWWTPGD